MARPPFMAESAEVATCWEQLSKLLQQEQEKNMLDDIHQSVAQREGLEELLYFAADADGSPASTIKNIKSNLGIDRNVSEDIEEATEAYNIAVCRTIGPAIHSTLPRELRDMVYKYLTTRELDIQIKYHFKHAHELHGRVRKPKSDKYFVEQPQYAAYFAKQPRSENDRICPERYWRDDVISSEVAYELIESLYRNSTFKMIYTQQVDREASDNLFKRLLNDDRFGTGLQPRELITKFTRQFCLDAQSRVPDGDVLRCLDDLFWFRKVTQVQVSVAFFHCRDYVGASREFLDLIRPSILRLRTLGYRCTLLPTEGWVKHLIEKIVREWEQELEAEIKRDDSTALSGA